MTASEEYDALLLKSGVSLASLGIRDIGLIRRDALRAVEILHHTKIPILGGDVYFRRGERVELAYANWFVDPKVGEDHETYLLRSWDTTEAYLKNFPPESADTEALFSIVVKKMPGSTR